MSVVTENNKDHLLNYEGVEALLVKINDRFARTDRYATQDTLGMIKTEVSTLSKDDIESTSDSGVNYPVQITTEGNAFVNVPESTGDSGEGNVEIPLVSTTADGLVPMADAAAATITSQANDWVLTKKGTVIDWHRLPSNAFNNTNTYQSASIFNCNTSEDAQIKLFEPATYTIGYWYARGSVIYVKFTNGNTSSSIQLNDGSAIIVNVNYKGQLVSETNPLNIPAGTVVCFVTTVDATRGTPGVAEVVGLYDFNGSDTYNADSFCPFAICSSPVNYDSKSANVTSNFITSDSGIPTGAKVLINFEYGNTSDSLTLNINGTGNKNIVYKGVNITELDEEYYTWGENTILEFVFNGTAWELITNPLSLQKNLDGNVIAIDPNGGIVEGEDGLRLADSISISGTMRAAGGFFETSDERLKDFHNDVEIDLNKLASLPKKYFTWKTDEMGNLQIGTSAQALQEIYPELVIEDNDGTLSVAYDKLSIIALKGIDVMNDKMKNLEDRIAKLEMLIENNFK